MEPTHPIGIQPIIVDTQKAEIPTFYCNQTRVALSQWDVTIDVGQADFFKMTQMEGKPTLPVEFKVRIMMSLQHTKAFALNLLQIVQKYEADFAQLALQPKAVTEASKEQK